MKQHFPAAARNRRPILRVLKRVLPKTGLVLELASGSGQHAAYLAPRLAPLVWQPSERNPERLPSIEAWRAAPDGAAGAANLRPPCLLDIADPDWPISRADAIIAVNVVHVSAIAVSEALMEGARRVLSAGGLLYLYGPFKVAGRHISRGNTEFDQQLRGENPAWGIRAVEDMAALAASHGLTHARSVRMPANNLSLIFCRDSAD